MVLSLDTIHQLHFKASRIAYMLTVVNTDALRIEFDTPEAVARFEKLAESMVELEGMLEKQLGA